MTVTVNSEGWGLEAGALMGSFPPSPRVLVGGGNAVLKSAFPAPSVLSKRQELHPESSVWPSRGQCRSSSPTPPRACRTLTAPHPLPHRRVPHRRPASSRGPASVRSPPLGSAARHPEQPGDGAEEYQPSARRVPPQDPADPAVHDGHRLTRPRPAREGGARWAHLGSGVRPEVPASSRFGPFVTLGGVCVKRSSIG